MEDSCCSRRAALIGGAVGLASLAACGSEKSATNVATTGSGTALAKTSEIPVGGGKVFGDQKVVVTQPTAGDFKAFSAVCTHEGCTVGSVSNSLITCPCHGAQYSITDGSVKKGPATEALPAASITVSGDEITLA